MLTLEQVKSSAPRGLQGHMTQEIVDKLNAVSKDPEYAERIQENFLSYLTVMNDGKFKTEDYLNAVTYVSYKLMGFNNKEAYQRTFPQRYSSLLARGASSKDISAYVAAYSKGRLVNLIAEQSAIPSWILNQHIYQKAINTQATLMMTAKSEKVRADAANSILTHLKRPETRQVELNIGVKEPSGVAELKDLLTSLAEKQQAAIESGVSTKEIAHQTLQPMKTIVLDPEAEEI